MLRIGELHTLVSAPSAVWPDVRVACVWLPLLPLRVEVLRRPELDGRPLVLGGAPGERKVVQLCSPEAEQAGIRPGLPLREVVPLCRDAVVLQPDPVRTAAVLEQVLARLQQVAPCVEVEGEHLFVDLRGLKALYHHDLHVLEQALLDAVPPLLRARIGIASGKFAAAVAARVVLTDDGVAHASGCPRLLSTLVVPARATRRFLAPLPMAYLPFEPDVLQRLTLLGLYTIGDLAGLPLSAVQAQLGRVGAQAWKLAHGQDDEPVVPRGTTLSVQSSVRFDDPLASLEAVTYALDQLLSTAFADPALLGRAARQVRLRALLADGTSWERAFTFKEALSSRDPARRALMSKLDLPNALPQAPVDELALELLGLSGEAARQTSLFVARAHQMGQIAETARQLRTRYGKVPLYHVVEVEPWSRIPERRWALVTVDL